MPSAKIHEAIATKINEEYNMDSIILRIGTISPDCWRNTLDPKYHDKFLAHFNNPLLDRNIKYDYDKFYQKYKDDINNPFYFGYLLHLIVDYYWKSFIDSKFTKKENNIKYNILKDGSIEEDKDYFEYYDSLKIQQILSKIFDLGKLPTNKEELSNFECNIEEIDLDGLFGDKGTISYANKTTTYQGIDEEPMIYDVDLVLKYIDETTDFVKNELKRLMSIKIK